MMQNKMKILGITGGSGCGKTYVSNIFRGMGIFVVDADIVARDVVKPGKPALLELVEYFGRDILNDDGSLNRKKLAHLAFSDDKKLSALNEITHKYISEAIWNMLSAYNGDIVGIDGAALIESGIKYDFLLAVISDKKIRKRRIMERDKLTEREAEERINAQKDDSFYTGKANFVIINNGDAYTLQQEAEKIVKKLREKCEKAD
ncbi:MAG: dephospho-CoA kinase [Clostridia bacterium]|nr:dephospho-CoA kinase [Clostridia bacterium]